MISHHHMILMDLSFHCPQQMYFSTLLQETVKYKVQRVKSPTKANTDQNNGGLLKFFSALIAGANVMLINATNIDKSNNF